MTRYFHQRMQREIDAWFEWARLQGQATITCKHCGDEAYPANDNPIIGGYHKFCREHIETMASKRVGLGMKIETTKGE